MAQLTNNQILASLAAALQTTVVNLEPRWTEVVSEANPSAWDVILSALMLRGFTAAQVSAWDAGADYHYNLTVALCLRKGAGVNAFDDKALTALEKWEERLPHVTVTIAGLVVVPLGFVCVGQGPVQNLSQDIFILGENQW